MKIRSLLFIAILLNCLQAISQNTVLGKWKPVFLTLDKIITADIKADTVFVSGDLDIAFKDDKDPEGSKELMQMMAGLMLQKMKVTEQEFLKSGEYIEKNTKRGTVTNGTYTFNASTGILIITSRDKPQQFAVTFKNDHLVLTGQLESSSGKKGAMLIEYEKLQ